MASRPTGVRSRCSARHLAEALEDERLAALRRHARTGRPRGAAPWIKRLEKRLGRPLAPRKAGRDDALVRVAPLLRRAPDWRAHLAEELEDEHLAALRRHARTGRPLGAAAWVKRLEKRLDRPLAPRKAGRKPTAGEAARAGGKRPK